jgi:cell division protein FtsX
VAAVGLVGGMATGAILGLLVVSLVRLTANAARPEPPLLVTVDWPVVLLAIGVYAVAAALLVGIATARAFRAPAPAFSAEAAA